VSSCVGAVTNTKDEDNSWDEDEGDEFDLDEEAEDYVIVQ